MFAPSESDWTWLPVADHKIQAHPAVAPPAPANGTLMRYREVGGYTWQRNGTSTPAGWTTPSEQPGHTYAGQLAWALATKLLSPWSTTKTAVAT